MKMIRDHEDTEVDDGASDDAIATAQSAAEFTFPPSYTEFLRHFNGGVIACIRLFGVGRADALDLMTMFENLSDIPPIGARTVFPFASDWGGSYFCFDLNHPRADGEFPIYYWNHEFSEEPAEAPYVWVQRESNFADFVRTLYS